ncbi:MAG: homoserine dehydrogenase [bacterium]|nr:homoserine dehydrogenase [bacterium]
MSSPTEFSKPSPAPSLRIGLFGFGCVGQGLWDVLHRTPGLRAEISKICVKDRSKERTLPASAFTFDKNDILNDPEINVVVELINDADAAFDIVSTSLRNGKAVVSANKRMIAEHAQTLLALQAETAQPFLYEAAVCGSIPIIRNLEEYYDNDMLNGIEGIVNGTTNYILTKLTDAHGRSPASYPEILKDAQRLGFAESDPTLDVQGFDAAFKTVILLVHGFGLVVQPEDVVRRGMTSVTPFDIRIAANQGQTIKLLSRSRQQGDKISAYVLPAFVPNERALAGVRDEYNAVSLQAAFSDAQFMSGKGAGSHPTASAVLSDIAALRYGYRYEYKKIKQKGSTTFSNDIPVRIYARSADDAILQSIAWASKDVEYRSGDGHYIIGTTTLNELLASQAFADNDTFIATA